MKIYRIVLQISKYRHASHGTRLTSTINIRHQRLIYYLDCLPAGIYFAKCSVRNFWCIYDVVRAARNVYTFCHQVFWFRGDNSLGQVVIGCRLPAHRVVFFLRPKWQDES